MPLLLSALYSTFVKAFPGSERSLWYLPSEAPLHIADLPALW